MASLTKVVDAALSLFPRRQRERLGRHILNVARGEGDGDPRLNGEYALLKSVKRSWKANRASPVVFDVGANVGVWAKEAHSGLPPDSKIYAFEPSPEAFHVLANIPGIEAMNLALGENNTRLPFYVSADLPAAETNSFHKRRAEVHFGLVQVSSGEMEIRRGDDVAGFLGISRIHFLKIDVEGHEVAVLKGFRQMLQSQSIDYIQFEYGSTWADSRTLLVDAFDLLLPLRYRLAKIHPAGVQLFPEYDQRQETFAFANYLAVREELVDTLSRI